MLENNDLNAQKVNIQYNNAFDKYMNDLSQ